jgi:hypothetical protein
VCGFAVLAFVALLFPFGGAVQPAFTHGLWVLVPMAAAAVLGVAVALRLVRWSASPAWTDRHRFAVIGAAVIAHTVFGAVAEAHTVPDRLVLGALVVATAVLLVPALRRGTT